MQLYGKEDDRKEGVKPGEESYQRRTIVVGLPRRRVYGLGRTSVGSFLLSKEDQNVKMRIVSGNL